MTDSSLVGQDIVPMLAGYLLVMSALAIGLRRLRCGPPPRVRKARERAPSRADERAAGPAGARLRWIPLIRHALATAAGGYLLLAAAVVVFYYAIYRVTGPFLSSAFSGTALLLAIAAPAFAVASWLTEWRRRAGGRPPAGWPRQPGRARRSRKEP